MISQLWVVRSSNAVVIWGSPNTVTDVDAALEQQILDIAQAQRKPNVHHDDQVDDLGRGVEIPERVLSLAHPTRLSAACPNRNFALTSPHGP